jgi:hypothetical protein
MVWLCEVTLQKQFAVLTYQKGMSLEFSFFSPVKENSNFNENNMKFNVIRYAYISLFHYLNSLPYE